MDHTQNFSYIDKRSAGMATASLVMGILALVLGCCVYPAFIFGSLAILFALLSRGGEMTMSGLGRAGMILGIIAMALMALYLIFSLVFVSIQYGGFENYLKSIYDMMDEMYPGYSSMYRNL